MDEQLTKEQEQDLWNQEAAKLEVAPETVPAEEPKAAAAEEPQQSAEPETQPKSEPEPQSEQPADPLAALPDVVRAKLAQIDQLAAANAQLVQHVRSAEGRVAAMQREFQQARAAQQSVTQAPTQGQIQQAAKTPEKWEALKNDFPEWAGAMEEYVAAKLGALPIPQPQQPGLSQEQVAAIVQQQVAQTKAEMGRLIEETKIESKYDNWKELVNTPAFSNWYSAQTPEIRSLADSTSARDSLRMLDLFTASTKKSAADVKQERGQRLAAAASTRPGATPPAKTVDDMSAEELWNYEAAKRAKELSARGF